MLSEQRTGPIVTFDGTVNPLRSDRTGATIVSDGHARYQEAVLRGNVYHSSMQAGASLGTALTATAVTITVYNPAYSGVNVVLLQANVAITTISTAVGTTVYAYGINQLPLLGSPTGTTAAVVRNCLVGGPAGKALAFTAATVPSVPVVARMMPGGMNNPNTVVGSTAIVTGLSQTDDIGGALILSPNTAVTIQGIGIATSGIVSMTWEEVAI